MCVFPPISEQAAGGNFISHFRLLTSKKMERFWHTHFFPVPLTDDDDGFGERSASAHECELVYKM